MKKVFKEFAYSLLTFFSGGKGISRNINGFKIRFPVRWSRYYPSDYESDNYLFLKEHTRPGMQIIDIGAHIGLFSAVSSQLVGSTGKIYCFEPTPGTYSLLTQTLKLNNCTNVTPVQGAVSNKEGSATFYISETAGSNSNSLVKHGLGKNTEGYEVTLYTIDGINAGFSLHTDLIKIDAEGAELDVLKGGLNTFKKNKPVLILGLHPMFIKQKGDSLEAIWELLSENGYKIELEGKTMNKPDFTSRTELFDVNCFAV